MIVSVIPEACMSPGLISIIVLQLSTRLRRRQKVESMHSLMSGHEADLRREEFLGLSVCPSIRRCAKTIVPAKSVQLWSELL